VNEELGDLVLQSYELLKRHNVIQCSPLGGMLSAGRASVNVRDLSVTLLAGESSLDVAGRDSTGRERAIELLKVCDSCVSVLSPAAAILLHNNEVTDILSTCTLSFMFCLCCYIYVYVFVDVYDICICLYLSICAQDGVVALLLFRQFSYQ
jgi:hypothetical protein